MSKAMQRDPLVVHLPQFKEVADWKLRVVCFLSPPDVGIMVQIHLLVQLPAQVPGA